MSDLVEKIRAVLDEDEQIAQGAAALCGCHGSTGEWSFAGDDHDGRITIDPEPHSPLRRQLTRKWNRSYEDMRMAQHIARHDPARVLRQVAAMRKILDIHEHDGGHECAGGRDAWGAITVYENDCPTILALAEAYGIEP